MSAAVVLYGPPAVGKDTVNAALSQLSPKYEQFKRLKCGTGRTTGYRMIEEQELEAVRSEPGETLWENSRYGATYIVDRSALLAMMDRRAVPVVHLGQAEAVDALTSALPHVLWLVVELWCARDVAAGRIRERATGDATERLAAYDATERLSSPDLSIATDEVSPVQAAQSIATTCRAGIT